MDLLALLNMNNILAVIGLVSAAIGGIYFKRLHSKAKSAEAWKARAETAERETEARARLADGARRIDAETNAGLDALAREAQAKKERIDRGKTAEEVAEDARRMFGGGADS